jgi:hypothetical protein
MPLAEGVGHGFKQGLRLTVRDHVAGGENLEGGIQGHGECGCERLYNLDSRDLGFLVHAPPHQMPIAEVEHPGAVATHCSPKRAIDSSPWWNRPVGIDADYPRLSG